MKKLPISKKVLDLVLVSISTLKSLGWVVVGGLFDFRVTPKSKFMLDVHLDVEFDNIKYIYLFAITILSSVLFLGLLRC